jgi:hypothetical protein
VVRFNAALRGVQAVTDYTKLRHVYLSEPWGRLISNMGLDPVDIESQARRVAEFAADQIRQLEGGLPLNMAQWPFYPVDVPLNQDGEGPVSIREAVKISYQVWDAVTFLEVATFDTPREALESAMKLTRVALCEPSLKESSA